MEVVYRPLKQKREDFRLLDLEAAEKLEDPLCGSLRHAKLHDGPFFALSYVWGDPVPDRSQISIRHEKSTRSYLTSKLSGKSIPSTHIHSIGSSLARALRYLRQKYGNITIWTDALCINQEDIKEKDWQVAMMSSIYNEAQAVHAWLGPAYNEGNDISHNMINAFSTADLIWNLAEGLSGSLDTLSEEGFLEMCSVVGNGAQISQIVESPWHQFFVALNRAATFNNSVQAGLTGLRALSQNLYFSRMWILQEMGRARRLTFHYGRSHIAHRRILLALSLAYSMQYVKELSRTGTMASSLDSRFLGCLSARTTCMKGISLREVLETAYFSPAPSFKATDSRDVIYARLGLAKSALGIKVSYKSSVADVYVATSCFLLSEGFLGMLTSFKPYKFQRVVSDDSFPSWAYDWSVKGSDQFDRYTASYGTSQRVNIEPYTHTKFRQALGIAGKPLGSVRTTNQRFSTTVLSAGLGKGPITVASLRASSEKLTPEKTNILMQDIIQNYRQLGISISEAELETLSQHRELPMASFWCWWVRWVSSIVAMIEDAEVNHPEATSAVLNVAELLFREDSAALSNELNTRAFGTKAGILALIDYKRWSTLLSQPTDHDAPTGNAVIQFAEALFRSAWGMRPIVLDSGRVGYTPEDTRPHDEVVIFFGVKSPLVIRRTTEDAYRIIGPAHICGAMQGQLMEPTMSGTRYKLV